MEAELKSLVKVSAWVTASMTYAHFISNHTNPGKLRLLLLLPVIFLLPYLPWHFSFISFRGISAFFLAWLSIFKLLLLSFNSGPLSAPLPLLAFVAIASLPIRSKLNQSKENLSSPRKLLVIYIVKLALLATVTYILFMYNDDLQQHLQLLLRCLYVYLNLDLAVGTVTATVKLLFPGNLEMEPFANAPLLATSLQDFWGRRWNLNVTAILRPSVYNPVRRRYGTAAAVMATFVVSGLMHEVIFYYVHFVPPTGEATAFFVLHGVCVVLENVARRAGVWKPPAVVATSMTLGFVAVTAYWLFFPALVKGEFEKKVLAEYPVMVEFVEKGVRWLFRRVGCLMIVKC